MYKNDDYINDVLVPCGYMALTFLFIVFMFALAVSQAFR